MRRFTVVLAAILCSTVMIQPALADKPTKVFITAPPPFTLSGSCSFDVRVEVTQNKEYIKTFTDGKQIISGRLLVKLTNLDTGKSITVQVNGPAHFNFTTNPGDYTSTGRSLLFFPGVLVLSRGSVRILFDPVTNELISVTYTSNARIDLCAVLAKPQGT
jgi:hypothetical protein